MTIPELEIHPDEVEELLKEEEKPSIIDVREHEEVKEGKIQGAKHIPLGELEERLSEIPKDVEHIMVCRSGSRSGMATAYLEGKGYKVKNMIGGMMNWKGRTDK